MDFSFVIVYSSSIVMKTAVLIPCYNEALTIKKVIEDFSKELPEATIYVYDNNSSDQTVRIAKEAGAVVSFENKQGKGNVVRTMFREIDADILLMAKNVDGIYDSDPKTNPFAKKYETLQYSDIINRNLKVIDFTAATMCMENNVPTLAFGLNVENSIVRAVCGEQLGTLIHV